jgi:hypothetical protein
MALSAPGPLSFTNLADTSVTVNWGAAIYTPPVIVSGGGIGPTPNSEAAAIATAQNNALRTSILPFSWEIGDQGGRLVGGNEGDGSITPTTNVSIASASKWVYGTYVAQLRGAAANLTANDILFMHMVSGYHSMPGGGACSGKTSVNDCLATAGYNALTSADIGKFFYDGAHAEVHASLYTALGALTDAQLAATVQGLLGVGSSFTYTQPLLAGGLYGNLNDYAAILRGILSRALVMYDSLGTHAVCTLPGSSGCNAVSSPIPEAWHYSMFHWVEDDTTVPGDGAFSSPGAFGFYPWIDASKTYYGVLSRQGASGQGYASVQLGRLIRHAWMTGVEQTGTKPTAGGGGGGGGANSGGFLAGAFNQQSYQGTPLNVIDSGESEFLGTDIVTGFVQPAVGAIWGGSPTNPALLQTIQTNPGDFTRQILTGAVLPAGTLPGCGRTENYYRNTMVAPYVSPNQNNLIHWPAGGNVGQMYYHRQWVRFDAGVTAKLAGAFAEMSENKTGSTQRTALSIAGYVFGSTPSWRLGADYFPGGVDTGIWQVDFLPSVCPVPAGVWFLLEFATQPGVATGSWTWAAINGHVLATGPSTNWSVYNPLGNPPGFSVGTNGAVYGQSRHTDEDINRIFYCSSYNNGGRPFVCDYARTELWDHFPSDATTPHP